MDELFMRYHMNHDNVNFHCGKNELMEEKFQLLLCESRILVISMTIYESSSKYNHPQYMN